MSDKKLPEKIVVASGNAHKIEEIKAIFKGVELVTMAEAGFTGDIEENGETFKENAYIKAKAVFDRLHLPVLADDSGLCVDALNGAPGVYSARFSGGTSADNRALLLKRLEDNPHRTARFVCNVCYIDEDGKPTFGEGATCGRILFEEIGGKGFGYDPLFFSDDLKKSFGEASEDEKNSVSHRYRALCDLREKL
ncbi:MAG: RdgB/HAM1 family non-canonical purine NTP pyrophosphatase [Clostridiales bacterium]|nr:RdgB/HAM1 family non-canonical purine NTP pyrophosphatase [Clostridiales bacterium]